MNMEKRHFGIDVVLKKSKRWDFKELLIQSNITYCEWFLELQDVAIITVDVDLDELEHLYNFIFKELSDSRLVLPNGTRVSTKQPFEYIKTKLTNRS